MLNPLEILISSLSRTLGLDVLVKRDSCVSFIYHRGSDLILLVVVLKLDGAVAMMDIVKLEAPPGSVLTLNGSVCLDFQLAVLFVHRHHDPVLGQLLFRVDALGLHIVGLVRGNVRLRIWTNVCV